LRNPNIERDRSGEITNVSESTVLNFHTDSELNFASYKNRINQLYDTQDQIEHLLNKDGLKPSTDYQKFLRLKTKDALNGTNPS
jgi:hypothetical protein